MENEKKELQESMEEIQSEYKEFKEEMYEEIEAAQSEVTAVSMHIFNISVAAVMIVIGIILAYQTRKTKQKSSKKIASWILLILGGITLFAHVIQLLF